MGLRRKSRELALQFLFSRDLRAGQELFDAHSLEEELTLFSQLFATNEHAALPYARNLVIGVLSQVADLDALLAKHSHNWRLERMSCVDRNILRLASYELLHGEGTPKQVVMNEALEIAKRYSQSDSVSFINGILDGLHHAITP